MEDKSKKKIKALSLISAGIDSPVATYLVQKRGIDIIAVHFNNEPLTDKKQVEKTQKICKFLGIKKLYIAKHGYLAQAEILKKGNRRYGCILCRRVMFKVAEKIAEMENCQYLVTGENMGQVASQTLPNLIVNDKAIKMTILRPVLGYDKNDIINIAKEIGTYEISSEPGVCCNAVPRSPTTKARHHIVMIEEEKIDINSIVDKALKHIEVVEF